MAEIRNEIKEYIERRVAEEKGDPCELYTQERILHNIINGRYPESIAKLVTEEHVEKLYRECRPENIG